MYRIIFQGQISDSAEVNAVKAALAALFRIDDEQRLTRLFSGNPVVIKKSLDEDAARRYLAAIERTGARVRVEPPLPAPIDEPRAATASNADTHADTHADTTAAADLSFQTVMQSFNDEPLPTAAPPTATETSATRTSDHLDTAQRHRWRPLLLGAGAALLVSLLLIQQFNNTDSRPLTANEQANLQHLFAIAAEGTEAEYDEALATVDDNETRQAMADLRALVSEARDEYDPPSTSE